MVSLLLSFWIYLNCWKRLGKIKTWDTVREPLRSPEAGKRGLKTARGDTRWVRGELGLLGVAEIGLCLLLWTLTLLPARNEPGLQTELLIAWKLGDPTRPSFPLSLCNICPSHCKQPMAVGHAPSSFRSLPKSWYLLNSLLGLHFPSLLHTHPQCLKSRFRKSLSRFFHHQFCSHFSQMCVRKGRRGRRQELPSVMLAEDPASVEAVHCFRCSLAQRSSVAPSWEAGAPPGTLSTPAASLPLLPAGRPPATCSLILHLNFHFCNQRSKHVVGLYSDLSN